MSKSHKDILARVERREAVVMTSQEVSMLVEAGEKSALQEVDVVTTATRAVMSGTYAVLSFAVDEPGSFFKARRAFVNDIPIFVGPCPNENLSIVDLTVFGTAKSLSQPDYGGGHLFRHMVEGKKVLVEVETDKGESFHTQIALDEMPHARLYGVRHAFKNYFAFVNPGDKPVNTIFHARGFESHCGGATFSGCGQINPIKNDPLLETIGMGTRILLNGADGFVLGTGTRSSLERPNLSGFADMHKMSPEYMGGFVTSAGPECICSWAVPIPVTSETILQEIARLDQEITLPIMDVNTRKSIGKSHYGDVWQDADLEVEFESEKCQGCPRCMVEKACPLKAVHRNGQVANRDEVLCFNCGLCVSQCPSQAFRCNLGSIRLETEYGLAKNIPVVLRQSDRLRALKLAAELKKKILDGSFCLAKPIEQIS